jgi:hypothetical protein
MKFCVKLSKSITETLEMLHGAFGEHYLSRTVVFEWQSHFKASQVSLEDGKRSGNQAPAEWQKMLKNFEDSSTKTVAKQSISSQILLGSVMELVRRF